MSKVFIDGEAYTTGLQIVNACKAMPQIELVSIAPNCAKTPAKRDLIAGVDLVVLVPARRRSARDRAMVDEIERHGPHGESD